MQPRPLGCFFPARWCVVAEKTACCPFPLRWNVDEKPRAQESAWYLQRVILPPPRAGWHKRAAPSRSLVTVSPFGVVSARIERGGAITRLSPRPHSARERTARWTAAAPHPPRDISLPVPAGIDKRRCSRRSHRGRIAGRSGRTDLRRRQEEALEEEEEEDASRVNVCERGGGCADRSGSKVSRPI